MIINTLAILLVFYVLVVLAVYIIQRDLLYFPPSEPPSKEHIFIPYISEITIETYDKLKLTAWFVPPREGMPIIIHFHGNAGCISGSAYKMQQLAARGYGFLFPEYRGYCGNAGKPKEKDLINDGLSAINYLKAKNYNENQIIVYGESLGSGIAIASAKDLNLKAVIIESGFSSITETAQEIYWYFPASLMVKDSFRNDLRIKNVKAPLLIIHGSNDNTVNVKQSQKLFNLANDNPKTLKIVDGGEHNKLFNFGLIDIVDNWIKTLS
ncbi:MAG: alpha/beta hydrolase [Alphaproteobacteria bacterium]